MEDFNKYTSHINYSPIVDFVLRQGKQTYYKKGDYFSRQGEVCKTMGFNRIASIIYQSTVAATKNSLAFILKGRFDLAAAIFYGVNSGLLRPSSDKKSVVSPDK